MTLQEIFDQLTHGELSQISIGGAEQGKIDKKNYAAIINHINLALSTIYKRFSLKQGRVLLGLVPGKTRYEIHNKFAQSNVDSEELVKYLRDSQDPYRNDLLKIERVLTEDGHDLVLNDETTPYALLTPNYKTLLVPLDIVERKQGLPDELKTGVLDLVYRANHHKLILKDEWGVDYFDELEVELPDAYLEALLYFVASRINNPIGMTNEFHAGNSYSAKYEQECARLEMLNLEVDQGYQNTRLRAGGWV